MSIRNCEPYLILTSSCRVGKCLMGDGRLQEKETFEKLSFLSFRPQGEIL
jgi:hypothetical protein